jgi:acyl-CoA reductase-like NAD-dependent aldehyde dehydrogenase
MELGGSDAYLVLEDANLEEATDLATLGKVTKQWANMYCCQTFRCIR